MEFSKTWDLDKYKSEFESDEHWQLRKKFMEAHKNQFPEEKLVCLARVFCNIEFLGCRYPEKTMKLVAELSKGVADNYREKQKGKLKRTFVQASDAAGAKIKGRGAIPPSKITEGPPSKIAKTSNSNPSTASFKYSCFVHEGLVKPPLQEEGEFPGFIIYESCKTSCPISILSQSAQKSKIWNVISFDFPAEKNLTPNGRCCEISLNKKVLSSGVGPTNKEAKIIAATNGLNKLRQTCYTIQEKLSFFTDTEPVSKEQVVKGKDAPAPLPQDNIGSKMMMKMGWTGAGLGKNQQGIQAPIEASQTMRRAGFGHLSTPQFHAKFRNVFKDYIASGSTNDLVFAPDFSAEERKTLHRSTELVEKVNQVIEESIQKTDKDDGEDLFGFDSDSEVIFPSSSDEEVEEDSEDKEADTQACEVCCKLDSLTGEESDDDLCDKMWGTGSDTSGLVNILEDIHMSPRKSESIEDQADNIEINAEYIKSNQLLDYKYKTVKSDSSMRNFSQSNSSATLFYHDDRVVPMLPNATNNVDSLLHSRISTVVSNLNRVLEERAKGQPTTLPAPWPCLNPPHSPPFLNNSFLPGLNHETFPPEVKPFCYKAYKAKRFRIFLPDGSFKRFHRGILKTNEELQTFISNHPTTRIIVTYQDLRTIKALRDLFPEFTSKLDSEEKLQSVPDYQANFGRPTAETNSKKIRALNTKNKTVLTHQLYDSVVTSNDGMIDNTGNPSLKSTLPNIQANFSEVKDNVETYDTRGKLSETGEMKLSSSSDMEIESELSDKQISVHSEAISQPQPKWRRVRAPRLHMTLADSSTVRVNTNYLKYNNYFIRHDRRKKGIANGLFKPDELPPPEYSDSSSDETETEWVPKNNLLISEPEGCEIDKVHVLRRRWEQFIVKFGSSKRNPYAKLWQNFVDQSPLDERKYLCQKWKEFLATYNEHEAERLPASILQPGHELLSFSIKRRVYIPPCDSSSIDPNLTTVYLSAFEKMKISKHLIFNNKSWTGRKTDKLPISTDQTPGFKGKCTKLFCQLSESETTTNPEQLVQNSGKVTSKLTEDRYSSYCKTVISKSEELTPINSVDEHKVVSEIDGENDPPLHHPTLSPNVQRKYDGFQRFRIFLPDGSFKRFHGSFLKYHKEFLAFINNQPTPRVNVTYQDLRENKALRDIFPEFASKLEEGLQSVPDYQANCDEPTAEMDSKKISDLHTQIQTVSTSQLCETAVISNDGMIDNTGNPSLKSVLPNIQTNSAEDKDDEVSHEIRSESAETNKMKLDSSSDIEYIESELSDNQIIAAQDSANLTYKPTVDKFLNNCVTDISKAEVTKTMSVGSIDDERDRFLECDEENYMKEVSSSCETDLPSCTLPVKRRSKRAPKIRLTLRDGCRVRIKASDLRWNKYFMCHRKRLDNIKKGLINPDEIPPPDYSDSSTDEEESDWVTKSGILVTEPENCEIDKNHILRKRWEQYILTIGSSKRNPFAKKWREFVAKSPAGENKTLCQKWKDFMMIIRPLQGATDMPYSVWHEGHKPITSFSQSGSNTSILSCDSSEPKVTDELHKHLQESTTCSTQSDLEKHINSSDLTVVYSCIDSPVSASKNKRTKPKKIKNPNLVTAYLGDGNKVKVDYILIPNKGTPDWLHRFKV